MSNLLLKTFHLCFSKIKCFPALSPPPPAELEDLEDEFSFIPNSSSINNSTSLIKDFNSFYELNSASTSDSLTEDFFSSGSDDETIPDFSNIYASQRFFLSTPGHSNAIVETTDTEVQEAKETFAGGIAIQTYSPDPYSDFRKSMQEMVEARELTNVKDNWEVLHELLLCYLTLNPKHTHKFIVNAFADLVICLMSSTN